MKTYTIKHSLRKNLPTGTLYNSQVAAVIFTVGMSFKLSAAPGIVAKELGSSTLWIFLAYTLVDLLCLTQLLLLARKGADNFLSAQNSKLYRVINAISSILLTMKAVFFFGYSSSYLTHELFTGAEPSLMYALFLLPVIYLGIKGTKTIARCCELFAVIFFAIILFNLAFLNTDLDIGRNLPIFSAPPSTVFTKAMRYGLWLDDLIPIVFIKIRDKKMPYISTSVAITWALVNVIVMLGVAIYGDALKIVSDLLIHMASFNQLTLEIGRMEWTNLFAMLIMSLFSLAFLYNGAMTSCKRAFNTDLPIKIAFPLVLICLAVFIPSAHTVTDFSIGWFGYVLFALSVAIPPLMLASFLLAKHKHPVIYKYIDSEYLPYQHAEQQRIDSLADGILDGYKDSAKIEQNVMPNGTLQPKENNEQN